MTRSDTEAHSVTRIVTVVRKRLQSGVSNVARTPKIEALEREWGRPLSGLLAELYIVRGWPMSQVAAQLHTSERQVLRWMVRYGIPRRTVRVYPPGAEPRARGGER